MWKALSPFHDTANKPDGTPGAAFPTNKGRENMEFNIALLKGDGIGPEIVESTVRVLEKTADKFGHKFNFTPSLIGGCAIDAVGVPLPQETVDGCLASDSVLLGAVGGAKWDSQPDNNRPEKALLGIRSQLDFTPISVLHGFTLP